MIQSIKPFTQIKSKGSFFIIRINYMIMLNVWNIDKEYAYIEFKTCIKSFCSLTDSKYLLRQRSKA